MANVACTGFIPINKGGMTISTERMRVLTNNTTAIFKFDALDAPNTGDVIVTATNNAAIYSVSMGASYMSNNIRVERPYLPATTTYSGTAIESYDASFVYVVDDMVNTKFEASVDTSAIALTNVNNNFAMTLGTGSTTTGLSGHTLTATGVNTTATLPWRLVQFMVGNLRSDPSLVNCHVIVSANAARRNPALEIGGSLGT